MLNNAQEIFGIFFAISFVLMLGNTSHYNAFDTYDVWIGKRTSQKRFMVALLVLNVLPILNFAWIIITLQSVNLTFLMDASNLLLIFLVVSLSFVVYGYYRIFTALLYKFPSSFYTNTMRLEYFAKLDGRGRLPALGARLGPGLLYVFVPNITLWLVIEFSGSTVNQFTISESAAGIVLGVMTLLAILYLKSAPGHFNDDPSPTAMARDQRLEYRSLTQHVARRENYTLLLGSIFIPVAFLLLGQAASAIGFTQRVILVVISLASYSIWLFALQLPWWRTHEFMYARIRGLEGQIGIRVHRFILDRVDVRWFRARHYTWFIFFVTIYFTAAIILIL